MSYILLVLSSSVWTALFCSIDTEPITPTVRQLSQCSASLCHPSILHLTGEVKWFPETPPTLHHTYCFVAEIASGEETGVAYHHSQNMYCCPNNVVYIMFYTTMMLHTNHIQITNAYMHHTKFVYLYHNIILYTYKHIWSHWDLLGTVPAQPLQPVSPFGPQVQRAAPTSGCEITLRWPTASES